MIQNRIIQALENRTAELKAEEETYRRESVEIRKQTEQIRKETEELKQMNPFELYYRPPGTAEHVKVNVALDQLFKEITELKLKNSDLENRLRYLELL